MKPLFGRQAVHYWRGKKFVVTRNRVLIPITKKVYPRMFAIELCGVQPISDEVFSKLDHMFKIRYVLPKKKQKWIDRRNARAKPRFYEALCRAPRRSEARAASDDADATVRDIS